MKTKILAIVALSSALACSTGPEPGTDRDAAPRNSLTLPGGPLKDSLATETAASVRAAFSRGAQARLSFGVYDLLEPVAVRAGTVAARAAALGLKGVEDPAPDNHRLGFSAGELRLTVNENSGSEFFADTARLHRGAGVPLERLLSDADYFAKGRAHVDRAFPAEGAQASLYPYKIRKYLNANAAADGPVQSEAVYQIAVAFNSMVDGLPVIGPGSKVVVHLTPDGEVIGHEANLRAVKGRRATLSGADLLSPDEAKAIAEKRMKGRGIELEEYRLAREELGYFRRGRNAVQGLLAPHYAYVYEPVSTSVTGRKVVELIPAIRSGPMLAAVEADESADLARKAEARRNIAPPSVK